MRHATISYCGVPLQAFLGDDDKCYLTLTSVIKGLNLSPSSVKMGKRRFNQVKGVDVLIANTKHTAYTVQDMYEFLQYQVKLGERQALAFTSGSCVNNLTCLIQMEFEEA